MTRNRAGTAGTPRRTRVTAAAGHGRDCTTAPPRRREGRRAPVPGTGAGDIEDREFGYVRADCTSGCVTHREPPRIRLRARGLSQTRRELRAATRTLSTSSSTASPTQGGGTSAVPVGVRGLQRPMLTRGRHDRAASRIDDGILPSGCV